MIKTSRSTTYADNTKLGQRCILLLDSLDIGRELGGRGGRREFAKKGTELLFLLGSVGGIPRREFVSFYPCAVSSCLRPVQKLTIQWRQGCP